jgi:hypothetical protein
MKVKKKKVNKYNKKNLIIMLDLKDLGDFLDKIDDDYFIKAQKITTMEISHAFGMAIKEKDLEIAQTFVKRKLSKI